MSLIIVVISCSHADIKYFCAAKTFVGALAFSDFAGYIRSNMSEAAEASVIDVN